MKKWIRWQGLIAFIIIGAALAGFWVFYLDTLVKHMIEKAGTAMVGAEVNVRSAKVMLVPLGITLQGLQVTNPALPSTNSAEITRIAFAIDSPALFRRKALINEMAVEGVRFDTPRKAPGFVAKPSEQQPEKEKQPAFKLPSFGVTDAGKILSAEKLEAPALIESAQADIRLAQDAWQKRAAGLPDTDALEGYKSRVEKLKKAKKTGLKELKGEVAEAKALKDDIERDLEKVRQARTEYSSDLSKMRGLIEKAEKAPMADVHRLADKYSLSSEGLQNLSQALFGDTIGNWAGAGMAWYGRLKPVMERMSEKKGNVELSKPIREKGMEVRFKEWNPRPDFLISAIKVSLQPEAGAFTGDIRNVTPDQKVLGAPTTFAFTGSELKDAQSISLAGTLNHMVSNKPDDTARLDVRGYRARDMVLSGNTDLPVILREGLVDVVMKGAYGAQGLSANINATVTSARLDAGKKGSAGMFIDAIASALTTAGHFTLNADISGQPGKLKISVSSDLDRVFKDAVGKMVREQRAKLEKGLTSAVQEKTKTKVEDLKNSLGKFGALGGKFDNAQAKLTELLKDAAPSGKAGRVKLR